MKKTLSKVDIDIGMINNVAKRAKVDIMEMNSKRIKKKEEEFSNICFYDIANHMKCSEYRPYLLEFGIILNKIKDENNKIDKNSKSLKVKVDIAEQLSKMKKYPPFDTLCYIESASHKRNSRFKYWVLKRIFKQKKYRIVFLSKKTKDKFYENNISELKLGILLMLIALFITCFGQVNLFIELVIFLLILAGIFAIF